MYSCESVLKALRENENVEFEPSVPACPKHADTLCAGIAGKCLTGSAKN